MTTKVSQGKPVATGVLKDVEKVITIEVIMENRVWLKLEPIGSLGSNAFKGLK